jgi:polyhydroxyalkanoate synthesis regulator phasin
MVREALTNYLSLASGLTEVTRQRARAAAKALAAQGEATREQVSGLAEEIVATSRANRHALVNIVRYEVERAAHAVGLARNEELDGLQKRVADLERQVKELRAAGGPTPAKAGRTVKASAKAPAKAAKSSKAPAKKAAKVSKASAS